MEKSNISLQLCTGWSRKNNVLQKALCLKCSFGALVLFNFTKNKEQWVLKYGDSFLKLKTKKYEQTTTRN